MTAILTEFGTSVRVCLQCSFNPFAPKSDQFQITHEVSPEILHHTAWRTWLSIDYSDEIRLYYEFSLAHLAFLLPGDGRMYFFDAAPGGHHGDNQCAR